VSHEQDNIDFGNDVDGTWRDEPVSLPEDDRLNRGPFAKHAARLIQDIHSADASVVYGLEGAWGSGKSSVISFITHFLGEPECSRWQVVQFTPWATSGTDALFAEFFSALGTALPEADGMRVRDKLLSYADIARPLVAAIPVVGGGLVEVSRTLEERLRKPWSVAFAGVAAELKRLETPILVVVDDIDRLQPSELLDLLKVVRLLGRFPGVDFLLAYDERTVVETLQDPQRGTVTKARARAFMEKIVQYPLSMPPLLTGQIVKMLDSGLAGIVTPGYISESDERSRLGQVIVSAMSSQLTTPRAIGRFLAQVQEQVRIHDLGEMNAVDLVLATFLRVQFPDLFTELQRWKSRLTHGTSGFFQSGREEEIDWSELLGHVDDARGQQDAREVLGAIFPAVRERYAQRAAPRRFGHPDYFDRYLAQTIPDGDIPDSVITTALKGAASGEPEALWLLLKSDDDEQVTLALSKLRARYKDPSEPWQSAIAGEAPVTLALLAAGMELVDELRDRRASWTSELSQMTYWMATIVRCLLERDPDADLTSALAACKQIDRRANVLSASLAHTDRLAEPTQLALRRLVNGQAEEIVDALLADLRKGDDSLEPAGSPFLFALVEEAGAMPQLKAAIREGLQSEDFTLGDVAARFVGFSYLVGGSGDVPSSAAFSGQIFTTVTGVRARSAEHIDVSDWPDTSWKRRREFAVDFIEADDSESGAGVPDGLLSD
jgi:hypothetical protein